MRNYLILFAMASCLGSAAHARIPPRQLVEELPRCVVAFGDTPAQPVGTAAPGDVSAASFVTPANTPGATTVNSRVAN